MSFERYREKTLDIPLPFYRDLEAAYENIETSLSEHDFLLALLGDGLRSFLEQRAAEERKTRLVLTPEEVVRR